jgi:hypothetical protein
MRKIDKYLILFFSLFIFSNSHAATFYARQNGNWNSNTTWSYTCGGGAVPTGEFPGAGDDVIVNCNGIARTITVNDTAATCRDLTIGAATGNATVRIINAANSLTITRNLNLNTLNDTSIYLLDAGAGTININGNTLNWGTIGINRLRVGSGTLNINPTINILSPSQFINFANAGTINFYSSVTNQYNNIVTFANCNLNFHHNLTISTTDANFNATSKSNFYGVNRTISPSAKMDFGFVNIMPSARITLSNGTGEVFINRDLMLLENSIFTINRDLEVLWNLELGNNSVFNLSANLRVDRNWVNNGGTLNGGNNYIVFTGNSRTIGGTSPTDFPNIYMGLTNSNCFYTLNQNITCRSLSFSGTNNNRTLTHGLSNPTITVNGNVEFYQPTLNSRINSWNINGGNAIVTGDLIFNGTNDTISRICRIVVTSGNFNLNGNITWMNNNAVATELISATTGTLTFGSSINMSRGSGTIRLSNIGTINLNGSTVPSLSLNDTITVGSNAVFSVAAGGTLNVNRGITVNHAALTLSRGSFTNFTGNAIVNPISALTFGHLKINNGASLTLNGNINLTNDWISDGGTFNAGTSTVIFRAPSGVQTITGTTNFYGLTANIAASTLQLNNDILITNQLSMTGHRINLNGFTLTLGDNAPATLIRSGNNSIAYNGFFRRWWQDNTNISSTAAPLYGLFPLGIVGNYRPIAINSTVAPSSSGYVTASHFNSLPVIDQIYNDNGVIIQRVSTQKSTLSTSGITGGTYNINVSYTGFEDPVGSNLTDYRLAIYPNTVSTVGTHLAAIGTIVSPICRRTGLTVNELNNDFVAATIDLLSTPIRSFYFSRVSSGNWSNNNTWSYEPGGNGPSCNCQPTTNGYVVISEGQTVNLDSDRSINFLDISNNATLTGTGNLNIGNNLNTYGTGKINSTNGIWTILGDMTFNDASISTKTGAVTVNGNFKLDTLSSFTISSQLSVSGDILINGNMSVGTQTLVLNGFDTYIGGVGNVIGTTGRVSITNGNKIIDSDAELTVSNFNIENNFGVFNFGKITVLGNITSNAANSTWINESLSSLKIAGELLTTGVLNTSNIPNTVEYNGNNQTVKGTNYHHLICSNLGTKTLGASTIVDELLEIKDNVILTENTNLINLSGAANLTMTDNTELVFVRSSNVTLPTFTGTYTLNSGTITINQSNGTATLANADYYNLKLIGSRPHNMAAVNNIQNNFEVLGTTATITNTGNLTIGGLFNYSTEGTSVLTGDVLAGSFLQSNIGTLNDGGKSIEITNGNWTRNGGVFLSTGEIIFSGANNQQIEGTINQNFNNFSIVKPNSSTLSLNGTFNNISVSGNWQNNGGVFDGGTKIVVFTGNNKTIGGFESTNFPNIEIASGARYNLIDQNEYDALSLSLSPNQSNSSLSFANEEKLNISGNISIHQPSADNITNSLNINDGELNVAGNLSFVGSNNTISRVAAINIKNGELNLVGNLAWMNNGGAASAVVETEKISLENGTINFSSPISMPRGSGTFIISDAGTINFNGISSTSFNFNSSQSNNPNIPVFQTAAGTTLKFENGLTNHNSTLNLHPLSNSLFYADGIIEANALVSFGNIEIQNPAVLQAFGDISIKGNWINNNGGFSGYTYKVNFDGADKQYIGGTIETFFDTLVLNNPNNIELDYSTRVEGVLNFQAGKVILNNHNLTLGNTAFVSNGNNINYIQAGSAGNVIKNFNSFGQNLILPIGDDDDFSPISFTLNSASFANNPRISFNVVDDFHPDLSLLSDNHISRYWTYTATDLTNANFDISLQFLNHDVVGDASKMVYSHFENNTWYQNTGVFSSNNTISWQGLTQFGDGSAVGDKEANLTFELLSFKAVLNKGKVDLTWITQSEVNNEYFTIERSSNGVDFDSILSVNGNIALNLIQNYATIDENPLKGISYYRLKQTDFDGKFTYSNIEIINNISGLSSVKFYPNPIGENKVMNLQFVGDFNHNMSVIICDSKGSKVYENDIFIYNNDALTLHLEDLNAGLYIISCRGNDFNFTDKLIVE